jgi:hypothetical protein
MEGLRIGAKRDIGLVELTKSPLNNPLTNNTGHPHNLSKDLLLNRHSQHLSMKLLILTTINAMVK